MTCEQQTPLGLDADEAVMSMDRRSVIERLKELFQKIKSGKEKWNSDTAIVEEASAQNLDNEL
jgi:hypothetical protein